MKELHKTKDVTVMTFPDGKKRYFKAEVNPHYDPKIIDIGELIIEGIDDLTGILISKARPRKRILRDRKRQLRLHEKTMTPPVRKWMKLQRETILKGLPKMYGRKAGPMVERLCDWKLLEEEALIIMKPPLLEVLVAGGKRVVEGRVLKQEEFDPLGPLAVEWTTEHAATLVTEVTAETQAAIRSYVAANLKEGVNARTIARKLRPLVGLTEKDLWAVANYEEWLIVNRPEYSAKTIKNMADVYARRKHRARTELIARTETANALDAGTLQGYGMMDVEYVDRIEDPECCEICARIANNSPYTIKESGGISFHPRCEGVWVISVEPEPEPYIIEATGPRQAKVPSLEAALKDLPRRHVMRVEKYYIDTTSQVNASWPGFKGRDIAGYWDYPNKTVHLNSKWMDRATIFHETGHAVYSTGIVPYAQKPAWKAWYNQAVNHQIKFPSKYSLTNESEFFAECYSHYYQKSYHLIDDGIKKWFDKTFKGGL